MKRKCTLLAVLFLLLFLAVGCSGEVDKKELPLNEKQESNNTNVTGSLKLEVESDTLIAKLESNVPDGGMFEILIMTKTDTLTAHAPIENGVLIKEFQIPDTWGPCYISGTAMLQFYGSQPQPQKIIDAYGEKGENMTGNLVSQDGEGKIVKIRAKDVAYPSEEAVKADIDKALNQSLDDFIAASDGLIISVKPNMEDAWDVTNVTVSDTWYGLQRHEKERFVEIVESFVSELVVKSGKDSYTDVYFLDAYGKEVAKPKVFGGYEIE